MEENFSDRALLHFLRSYIAPHKLQRMHEVLIRRTRYIVPVFENMYQAHNIHAAMRSLECQSFQEVQVIDDHGAYFKNTSVTKGAAYWLDVHRFAKQGVRSGAQECFAALKQRGYRIYAADFAHDAYTPETVPLDKPCAFVTGTEQIGVSAWAKEQVDGTVMIPMSGFTQSYNVSVTVGILSYILRKRIEQELASSTWLLSEIEQQAIELQWLRSEVKGAAGLEKQFFKNYCEDGGHDGL